MALQTSATNATETNDFPTNGNCFIWPRAITKDMPEHFNNAEGKNHSLLCNKFGGETKISIEFQFESGAPAVAVEMRLSL